MFNKPALKDMFTDEVVNRLKTGNDSLVIIQSGTAEALDRFRELMNKKHKKMLIFGVWTDNPFLPGGNLEAFRDETNRQMQFLKDYEIKNHIDVVPSGLIFYDLLANPVPFKGLRRDYLFVPGSSIQNDLGTLVNVAAIYAVATDQSPAGLPMWDPFPSRLVIEIQKRVWKIVIAWKDGDINPDPIPDKLLSEHSPKPVMSRNQPLWPPLLHNGDSIFYVGNSFIGTEGGLENHFPRLLSEISPSMKISTSSRIFWGRGLQSMYTEDVLNEIHTGRNAIVVVTSGPVDLLKKFKREIEKAGSQMVVHMTWGRNPTINKGGLHAFRQQTVEIVDNMQKFEKETGVPVIPCGLIFYDLVVDPPKVKGLREDWVFMVGNIHQNHLGTMANASAHYAVMTGCSPVGLPMWDPYPPELIRAIQERAWKIIRDWKAGKAVVKELPVSHIPH